MNLEFFDNRKAWNKLVLEQGSSFMQSWEWGEFKKKLGHKIWRVAINKDNQCLLCAQIIKHNLPLNKSYFYIPKGPILNYQFSIINFQPIRLLTEKIGELAKKEGVIFLKVEPNAESGIKNYESRIKKYGFIESNSIQPKDTLILDITKSEEELMAGFHHKTRYNIRLADKKGVSAREIRKEEFNKFYNLIYKTDERKHIKSFNKRYYQELFNLSQASSSADASDRLEIKFLAAFHKKEMIAGLILIFWDSGATYLVGANDYQYHSLMAPHFLQWQAIKLARNAGCQTYDLWGIIRKEGFEDEKDFESHPWQGITRFKQGFGGKEITYIGAYDYVFSPFWYKLYKFIKKFKK